MYGQSDGGRSSLSSGGSNLHLPVTLSVDSPKLWHTRTVEEKDGSIGAAEASLLSSCSYKQMRTINYTAPAHPT